MIRRIAAWHVSRLWKRSSNAGPLTLTRPISTMHTAKTQRVRQPQRNRFLLRPKPYYRHYGPAAWIDPVVLRAIAISWNDIRIPVRHRHPDDKPRPWFTNDFGILRMGWGTQRPQVTQHQGRSESERYGQYPHASASSPTTDMRLNCGHKTRSENLPCRLLPGLLPLEHNQFEFFRCAASTAL
jgi:hypothetical protein